MQYLAYAVLLIICPGICLSGKFCCFVGSYARLAPEIANFNPS